MTLYAFGNGSFGCMFDNTDGPFESLEEAASAAGELFELNEAGIDELASEGFLNLVDYRETFIDGHFGDGECGGQGADYIEIFEVGEDWRSIEEHDADEDFYPHFDCMKDGDPS